MRLQNISFTESLNDTSISSQTTPISQLATQLEEYRYLYYLQAEFSNYLSSIRQINPYLILGQNKFIVSKMCNYISPLNHISVYYQFHQKIKITQQIYIPNNTKLKIVYLEFITKINSNQPIQIKNYEIQVLKQLGQGGFGIVKAGKINNENIALKFYTREKDNLQVIDYGVSASFLREVYILALLQNNSQLNYFPSFYCGIVSQYDGCVILQQRLRGRSLYELMKDNMKYKGVSSTCFQEEQVILYFLQMLIIIRQLVVNHIIHCDCKIDNWMINNGQIYIIDFGKAINLQLFRVDNNIVQFPGDCLNSVSPSPSCAEAWAFEADFCALASCLFSLVQGRLLVKEDIIDNQVVMKASKYMKKSQLIHITIQQLLFSEMKYITYDQQQQEALEQIDELIQQFSIND
eukprot:EST46299.1 Kinase [Spironucleus salmonicida]